MMDFKDKVAVITGGAQGIGRSTAMNATSTTANII